MKKTSRYIFVLAGIVLLAGGLLLSKNERAENKAILSTKSVLTPEKTITHAHGLLAGASDENVLYIATHHGLLLLKDESLLFRIGESHDDYMGFISHPSGPDVFYSSGHPFSGGNLGIQRSLDGGFTWAKVSNGVDGPVDFHAFAASPVDGNVFYGWYQGDIQRSDDGGKTWAIVNTDILAVHLLADPKDVSVVYASTPDGRGVQVSRDRGVTWKSLSPELEKGQVATLAVNPDDPMEMFVSSERLGGVGKSVDGGKTWKKLDESFGEDVVLFITYDQKRPGVVYALTHKNAIYKSDTGGESWKQIY